MVCWLFHSGLIDRALVGEVAGKLQAPASFMIFLMSSLHSMRPYLLVILGRMRVSLEMKVAKMVSDCLPLPPSPTNKPLPLGILKSLQILDRCIKEYLEWCLAVGRGCPNVIN